jgi:hypothetical protein
MISGGVYVTRTLDRPEWLGEALLPLKLVTLSSCLTQLFPGESAIEWGSSSEDDRLRAVEKLGISPTRLPSLVRQMTDSFDPGPLGWPSVWSSVEAARAAARDFDLDESRFALVELGVPDDFASLLPEQLPSKRAEGSTGLYRALAGHSNIPPNSAAIGWELLGAEIDGSLHSWLCNSLHAEAFQRLGLRPAASGLLASEQDARAVVELIKTGVGALEVPWFPGKLVLHPWDAHASTV